MLETPLGGSSCGVGRWDNSCDTSLYCSTRNLWLESPKQNFLHVHWALTELTLFWESITWDEIGKPWTADKSQPSGGKVCFKLSSWVLLFSKGISATLRTGKRNNFPKMLRVELGTTGTAKFCVTGGNIFCWRWSICVFQPSSWVLVVWTKAQTCPALSSTIIYEYILK